MSTWNAMGPLGADRPIVLIDEHLRPIVGVLSRDDVLLHPFDAADRHAAIRAFDALKRWGIRAMVHQQGIDNHDGVWRARGAPYYLDCEAYRLGVTPVIAHRARQEPTLTFTSRLIGELHPRYEAARAVGRPVQGAELMQIRGALSKCEEALAQAVLAAAANIAMVDDVYRAFGLPLPRRTFELVSQFDAPVNGQPAPVEPEPVPVPVPAPVPAKTKGGKVPEDA